MRIGKYLLITVLAALTFTACTGGKEPASTTSTTTTEEIPQMTEVKNGLSQTQSSYRNKLTDSAADPFILEHDGIYYLYSTGGKQFTVRTSTDLLTWQAQKQPILKLSSDLGWAEKNGWAPEMYEYNGKFYFIFCCI